MKITLDRQVVSQRCPDCERDFTVVRGSVFDEGIPIGLYLIGLHGHTPHGRLAHLALTLLENREGEAHPVAAALDVTARPEEFAFSVVEWADSPWRGEHYLGELLGRDRVLVSPLKDVFFEVADRVTGDISEVQQYFA